tara:strand:- start:8181 stop:9317 length:1137 start_codon:yes stop_codon:yes gene_type:complete
MAEDFYSILGVSRTVTAVELKKAYRSQAMKYHPDRNPGDKEAEEKFKILSEAYETLSDDQKRAHYDQVGHEAYKNGGASGGPGGMGGFGFSGGGFSDIFEEVFGDFMGGGRRGQRASAQESGEDLKYELSITLEQAYTGFETEISYNAPSACSTCNGSGSKSGTGLKTCSACHGSGAVRMQQGFFMIERPCVTCRGQGQIIEDPCTTCHGQGITDKKQKVKIKIPAGVPDNARMRVSGKGGAGPRGGPPGDLYVFITVKPHELYTREENDLFCRLPITVFEAIQGTQKTIMSLENDEIEVSIPAGTQPNTILTKRKLGMPVHGYREKGDLHIEVQVEVPTKLTSKQKQAFSEFYEQLDDKKAHPEVNSFWKKAKKLWG